MTDQDQDINQELEEEEDDFTVPVETSPEFVDREEFLLQRYKKLKAETLIKEEQAQIERLKKEKLEGELISLESVEEAFKALGAHTKARLKRLITELPPKLSGLEPNEMVDVLRNLIDDVLDDLTDITTKLKDIDDSQ